MGGPITITVEYGMRESYMVLGGIGGGGGGVRWDRRGGGGGRWDRRGGMVLGGIGGGDGVRWDRRGRRWC